MSTRKTEPLVIGYAELVNSVPGEDPEPNPDNSG